MFHKRPSHHGATSRYRGVHALVGLLALCAILMAGPASAQEAILLDAATAVTNGVWIDFRAAAVASNHVTGTGTFTLEHHVSNAIAKPSDATDGIVVSRTMHGSGLAPIVGPFRWVKVKLTECDACSVTAIAWMSKQGDGSALLKQLHPCNEYRVLPPVTDKASASKILLPAVANVDIYICDVIVFASGTTTFQLVAGTGGATCPDNQENITPALDLTAQVGFAREWHGLVRIPPGKALCGIWTGAQSVAVSIVRSQL